MRWYKLISVCLLFAGAGLLTSCMTPSQAIQRVTEIRPEVPEMPLAELLAEDVSVASGSQDSCIGAQSTLVYGSNFAFDEVLAFYQNELLDAEWEDVSVNYIVPTFQKEEVYFLTITEESLDRVLLLIGEEYHETVETRASQFSMLFLIRIGFTTCPSG